MKVNKYIVLGILGFILWGAPLYAEIVGSNDTEIKEIVDPILDNILRGFAEDNYEVYVKDFDETLKETISEKRFQEVDYEIKTKIGSYLYREYLGFLNRGKTTIVFWKGVFDKTKDEILIKLNISKRDTKYLVTGIWFQ